MKLLLFVMLLPPPKNLKLLVKVDFIFKFYIWVQRPLQEGQGAPDWHLKLRRQISSTFITTKEQLLATTTSNQFSLAKKLSDRVGMP